MLDYLWKKFKRDNDVAPEAEESSYVNIRGLEQDIKVPSPTKADKRWARKLRNATSSDVATALISAIETGQNWRVWYLINRPVRKTSNFLIGKVKHLGFDGNVRLSEALSKAAENDNVTAAYLLLKFAEKNQTTCFGIDDVVREEIEHYTRNGLVDMAEKPGSGVFRLVAQTFATLADGHTVLHRAERQMMMNQAAIRAAANGHQSHLDAILDNHLLEPRQFVEAYMQSFYFQEVFGGEKDITAEERKPFIEWMKSRGIVDEVFEEEAAAVEVRVRAQKETLRESLAKGWKYSSRWLPNDDGTIVSPGTEQVEIGVRDAADGQPLTYVFNYSANRAHKLKGNVAHTFSFAQLDSQSLLEEGRAFLTSSRAATPELVWKKGEPFRLRLKDQKPG
jgi:hypothetical protein